MDELSVASGLGHGERLSASPRGGDFGKVAVLMGGQSSEREVSLDSGRAVHAALRHCGVDAHPVDVDDDIVSRLSAGHFDRAFIALHGGDGENGVIQAVLQRLKIPYTGSGVAACALSMDKVRCKQLWQGVGLPTLPFSLLTPGFSAPAVLEKLGLPLAVKPCFEGSTVGVSKVETEAALMPAFETAVSVDDVVLAEPWAEGEEYTVGVVGDTTLPVICIRPENGFYDYHAKYVSEQTQFLVPSGLTDEEEADVKVLARRAYDAVGCSGWGRVDVVRDLMGTFWLLEVNTVPGLTSHSLVPTAARAMGIDFEDLVMTILSTVVVV